MPPRKPRTQPEMKSTPEPYPINPVCAANLATITADLLQVTKIQDHLVEKIEGNGKIGLEDQTTANTRDIADLTKLIASMAEAKKTEADVRQKEAEEWQREVKQRKSEIWKWWLGIAAAALVAMISIVQNVATVAALNNLDKLLPALAK